MAASAFAARLPGIDTGRPSPNHEPRAEGFGRPSTLVLHYTGMQDGPAAIERLCDPASKVSCHYVITEAGGILQLVDERQRAWCCGRSFWQGITDLNSASINIEIVNGGHDYGLPPFPDAQIESVIRLGRDIVERHGLLPERVLAHSDIAPSRKQDPGERFPWARLADGGVGLWVEASADDRPSLGTGDAGPAVKTLQAGFLRYGYGLVATGVFDAETAAVVQAFQRHFRPHLVDGVADAETQARLVALLDRLSA